MVKYAYNKDMNKIMQKRILRNFIDLLILLEVSKRPFISGYDIIVAFQRRFNLFISPGTIYLTLYTLEREGLIRGEDRRRKRVYILTSKGEKFIEGALAFQENIKLMLSKIFMRNNYPKLR